VTCILGTKRFVCADRCIEEDGAVTSLIKVASNPWLIAAAAGLASAALAVKQAIRAGAETPEDLLDAVGKDSYAIVVTWDRRLVTLSEGAVWPVKGPVVAVGTGADLALGYMHGVGVFSARVAREAQRFVAKRRADCGGGCDVRSFE
jgi:CxxC motif-containing protein (DUF1111 family)